MDWALARTLSMPLNHQIDFNDLLHVIERVGNPSRFVPAPESEGGNINPHVSRFFFADGSITDVFHVKPVYYRHVDGGWRPMSEVASHYGNHRVMLKEDWADKMELAFLAWLLKRMDLIGGSVEIPSIVKMPVSPFLPFFTRRLPGTMPISERYRVGAATISFSTLTAYPDPNPETTTVDGRVEWFSGSGVWSTAQAATDGTTASDSNAGDYLQVYHRTGSNLGIDRGFFLFDTSSITSGATISAATFSMYTDGKGDENNDSHGFWNVVQSNPASNTALSTADYDQCGDAVTSPTKGASDVDTTTLTTSAYTDFALNASGIGWVSKTGVTKLGVRNGQDMDNANPGNSGDGQYLHVLFAETASTTSDPKLVVTYSTSTNITVTPSVLNATIATQSATVSAQKQVTVTPSAQNTTFATQTATVTGTASVAPNRQNITIAIQSPQVLTPDAVFSVNRVNVTIATYAPTPLLDCTVFPSALNATWAVQTATFSSGFSWSQNALGVTFAVGAPSFSLDSVFGVNLQDVVIAIVDPVESGDAIVSPSTLNVVFATLAPSVLQDAVFSAPTSNITIALLVPEILGDRWQENYASDGDSGRWSETYA